jgi:transposase
MMNFKHFARNAMTVSLHMKAFKLKGSRKQMGLFSGKKESISLSNAEELLSNPRALRGMSNKEIKELKDKAAGKGSIFKDIQAARTDAQRGRKTGGVGTPPPVRKGKSIFAPDSSKGTKAGKKQ